MTQTQTETQSMTDANNSGGYGSADDSSSYGSGSEGASLGGCDDVATVWTSYGGMTGGTDETGAGVGGSDQSRTETENGRLAVRHSAKDEEYNLEMGIWLNIIILLS